MVKDKLQKLLWYFLEEPIRFYIQDEVRRERYFQESLETRERKYLELQQRYDYLIKTIADSQNYNISPQIIVKKSNPCQP